MRRGAFYVGAVVLANVAALVSAFAFEHRLFTSSLDLTTHAFILAWIWDGGAQ